MPTTDTIEQAPFAQVVEEVADKTVIDLVPEEEASSAIGDAAIPASESIIEETKTLTNAEDAMAQATTVVAAATASEEEMAEDAAIDSIIDDLLGEEELVAENSIVEEVSSVEPSLTETEILAEQLSTELTETPQLVIEELSEEEIENDLEFRETTAVENELGVLSATAAGTVIVAKTVAAKTQEVAAFIPLKESDLLRNSHELIQKNEVQEGLSLLEKNLEANPEMVAARYQYAVFLAQFNNDYKSASEQLEIILTKDTKNLPANFFLGELAEAQGDFLSARNYYERVEAINPNFPNLQYKLGLLLSRRYKNNSELAASYLQKAYEKNPRNIDALYNLGVVQNEGLSMPLDAIVSFEQVLEEQPQHAFVNYDLALANYKIGDRKAALAYYEKACEINEELKTPENDLAFALPEKEEFTESTEALVAEENLLESALVGAALSENNLNGSNNNRIAESSAPIEIVEPSYTLEVPETTIIEEEGIDAEDLGMVDLAELIDQGNREVSAEAGIDEEQLEAEFDAQIGALGAAGLGIAAGAAIKEESEVAEEQVSNIVEETAHSSIVDPEPIANQIPDIEREAVVIPAAIPEKSKVAAPTNKVVLITGATSGIGKATDIEFAKK